MQRIFLALCLFLSGAGQAWACAVCGFGADESTNAFLKGTALLSLMPLGFIGGALYYLYRRTHPKQPVDVPPGSVPVLVKDP